MNKLKSILALLLAAAMCLMLLAACGSSSETADTSADTDASETDADDEDDGEIVNIKMTYLDIQGLGETADEMVDALNAITEPEIGVHVDISFWGIGDYATQVSLVLSSGEQMDLIGLTSIPGSDLSSMHATSQLLDISEYLSQDYASGLMEIVEPYLDAFTFDGGIFGVPAYRNYATNHYLVMRADILDEIGMTEAAQNMTTWEEYEEILAAVYDAYNGSGMYPVSKGDAQSVMGMDDMLTTLSGSFDDYTYYDKLGDSTNSICATVDGEITPIYEQEVFEQKLQKLAVWNDNGWIYPDSAFDTENMGSDLVKSGVSFSYMADSEYGIETSAFSKTGYDCVCTLVGPKMVTTTTLTAWGIGVPATSEEPEAAVKFLNLMYTNADVMNVLMLGVEGTDYEVTDGVADWVDGDSSTASWHGSDWIFGNQFLVYPFENTSDYRDICLEQTQNLYNSPYLGFAVDTTDLQTEVASLTSVASQYGGSLYCGQYTESLFNEYVSAMQAAGIDTYISTIQDQLAARG